MERGRAAEEEEENSGTHPSSYSISGVYGPASELRLFCGTSAKLDLRPDAIARCPGVEVSSRSLLSVPSVPVASQGPSASGLIPPPPEVFRFFGLGPELCGLERQMSGVRTAASRHPLAIPVGRLTYCHSQNDQISPVNNRRQAPVNRPVNRRSISFALATSLAAGTNGSGSWVTAG